MAIDPGKPVNRPPPPPPPRPTEARGNGGTQHGPSGATQPSSQPSSSRVNDGFSGTDAPFDALAPGGIVPEVSATSTSTTVGFTQAHDSGVEQSYQVQGNGSGVTVSDTQTIAEGVSSADSVQFSEDGVTASHTETHADGSSSSASIGPDGVSYTAGQGGENGDRQTVGVGPDGVTVTSGTGGSTGPQHGFTASTDGISYDGRIPNGTGGDTPGTGGTHNFGGSVGADGIEGNAGTTVGNPRGNNFSVGVGFSATETDDVSSAEGFTTSTVTGEVSFSAEAAAKLGQFGVGGGVEFSTTQTQTVRVPDDVHAEIEAGDRPQPNQFDPESIPVGGSVTTSSADARGTELSASYGGFSVSSDIEETDSVSVAVDRVDEDTVRVTSGPTEVIEATNTLGFSAGGFGVSLGSTRALGEANLNTVEFDISTQEGRDAYDAYLATGDLPEDGAEGVNDITQTRRITLDQDGELGVSVFGFDLGVGIDAGDLETVLTTHSDGSRDQVSVVTNPTYTATAVSHFPPGSDEPDSLEYTLDLQGVDGGYLGQFNEVYGETGTPEGAQDVQLTFSGDDIEAIQELAREQIIAANVNRGAYTEEEVTAALDDLTPENASDFEFYGDPNWVAIAAADSPDDVMHSLGLMIGNGGTTGFISELTTLAIDTGRIGEGLPFGYEPVLPE